MRSVEDPEDGDELLFSLAFLSFSLQNLFTSKQQRSPYVWPDNQNAPLRCCNHMGHSSIRSDSKVPPSPISCHRNININPLLEFRGPNSGF